MFFLAVFAKGEKFCNFLFAFLGDKTLPKGVRKEFGLRGAQSLRVCSM